MSSFSVEVAVRGPWSLDVCRQFWEGFTPSALPRGTQARERFLRTAFRVDADWSAATGEISQRGQTATIAVAGSGDLDAAAAQVGRFLSLDVDARAWPEVGNRDEVIASAQAQLPGLRPCGFHSPYEAAAWSVLSQRLRVAQAAKLRDQLVADHGENSAFPAPAVLRRVELDLPGRKAEYLRAVADAALDGELDGARLHAADPELAISDLQSIKGIGPFGAELIVLRGATAPDAAPREERRLEAVIADRYGPGRALSDVAEAWRPFRTWAAFYLRASR